MERTVLVALVVLVAIGRFSMSSYAAPLTPDPALDQQPSAALAAAPMGATGSMVPSAQRLSRNPMLPQHPLGQFSDSQYEADDAMLRRQVAQQYADILQQLGYVDDNGQFIQGSVEAEANKQAANYQNQQRLAAEQVTRDAQNQGTLFSGIRGTLQGRAEDPFVRARADLMAATPLSLQQLYERAAGLSGDYVLQQNQLLASAASRRAQAIAANPPSQTPAPVDTSPPADTTPVGGPNPAGGIIDLTGLPPGTPVAPIISPTGTTSPFEGGAPGGVVTGDPEHNAFISGASDVDPFAVGVGGAPPPVLGTGQIPQTGTAYVEDPFAASPVMPAVADQAASRLLQAAQPVAPAPAPAPAPVYQAPPPPAYVPPPAPVLPPPVLPPVYQPGQIVQPGKNYAY